MPFQPLPDFAEFTFANGPLSVPERAPVLSLKNSVLLPGAVAKVLVVGDSHLRMLAAMGNEDYSSIVAVTRRRPSEEAPTSTADLFPLGVVSRIRALRQEADDAFMALLECGPRCRLLEVRTAPVGAPPAEAASRTIMRALRTRFPVAALEDAADAALAPSSVSDGERELLDTWARRALVNEFESATWAADFLDGVTDIGAKASIAAGALDLDLPAWIKLLEEPALDRIKEILWLLSRNGVLGPRR